VRAMDCREFELLIALRTDGAITKDETAELEKHLAGCAGCCREMALQERLSHALHEAGREEIEAPPEFHNLVMSRLRLERRKSYAWLPDAWRKTIAAAAAVLLLAGGSAGVSAGLKLAGGGKVIATNPVQSTGVDTGGNIAIQPGDNTQVAAGGATSGSEGGAAAGNDGIDFALSPENPVNNGTFPIKIAAPQTALLSSGLKITGTILKVDVDNLLDARARAVALAAGSGAVTQVFPEQSGGKSIVVLRIAVPSGSAPDLIAGLSGIGMPYDRMDESRDVTSLYNETMVQYLDLQTRINSSQNAEERRQMAERAGSYKLQLDAWNAEAGKQIITLWLESQ
jgi:hypothetical protein